MYDVPAELLQHRLWHSFCVVHMSVHFVSYSVAKGSYILMTVICINYSIFCTCTRSGLPHNVMYSSSNRDVYKFVRVGGWDVVKCIYVNILLSKYNVKQYYYIG